MGTSQTKDQVSEQDDKTKPKLLRASDFVTFYANGARLAVSDYDVRIYFSDQGQDLSRSSGEPPTATERVCVIMAPGFVREVARQLENLVCMMDSREAE